MCLGVCVCIVCVWVCTCFVCFVWVCVCTCVCGCVFGCGCVRERERISRKIGYSISIKDGFWFPVNLIFQIIPLREIFFWKCKTFCSPVSLQSTQKIKSLNNSDPHRSAEIYRQGSTSLSFFQIRSNCKCLRLHTITRFFTESGKNLEKVKCLSSL